jgi:hypothetical protein
MCDIFEDVLGSAHPRGLSGHIEAIVHALLCRTSVGFGIAQGAGEGVPVFQRALGSNTGIFDKI